MAMAIITMVMVNVIRFEVIVLAKNIVATKLLLNLEKK